VHATPVARWTGGGVVIRSPRFIERVVRGRRAIAVRVLAKGAVEIVFTATGGRSTIARSLWAACNPTGRLITDVVSLRVAS
jgi:hypothetical protein